MKTSRAFDCLGILFISLLCASFASPAVGAMFTIDAVDSGFVTVAGGSSKGDGTIAPGATYNYSVGQEEHYGDGALFSPLAFMDKNNYFVFDTSGITGTIIGVALKLPTGTLESVDATETFDLVAPLDPGAGLGDADALLIGNGIGPSEFDAPGDPLLGVASALYGNIEGGAGSVLASSVISSADDGTILTIPFDPFGVGYVESFLGGPLFLGGTVSTITPGPTTQQPFGFVAPGIPAAPPGSDLSVPMLVIVTEDPVPEPTTYMLAILGLLGLGLYGWRRRA